MRKHLGGIFWAGCFALMVLSYFYAPEIAPGTTLAMAVITGARPTAGAQGITAATRVVDMSDVIHLLDPNEAPLTAVTMRLRKAHAINPKVSWLEDDYLPSSDVIAATCVTAATSVTVTNQNYFRTGDVLKVLDSGEVLHVTGYGTTADTLLITRSIGATAAAQISNGGTLLIIGNANAEGSTKRTISSTQKTEVYNYTQIFRWPFGVTGTTQSSELYGGNDLTYQTRKNGIEHRIQLERAYLFGEKKEDTSGATALRFCDGVIARIATNVTNVSTTMTSAVLETVMRAGFRYGPKRKMAFVSREIASYISQIAGTKIQTVPSTKSFPLALTEYISPHGKLYIVTHNLLTGSGGNNTSYSGWGLILDIDSIFHRYMRKRDTHIVQNIQANDEDSRIDEYKTESCPMLVTEKNHAIFDGVTAFS